MIKKKTALSIFLLLLLGLILSSCEQKQEVKKESDIIKKQIITQENTIAHAYLSDLKTVLTKEKFTTTNSEKNNKIIEYWDAEPLVSQKYTVYEESQKLLTSSKDGLGDTIVDVDTFYLNVYRTKEGFPFEKKIDVKKILQSYNSDYLPYMTSSGIGRIDGVECVSFNIYSKKAKTWGYASVSISLEDDRVIAEYKKDEYSKDLKTQAENKKPVQFNILRGTVTNLPEKLHADYTTTTQINYSDAIDIKNQLTKQHPELSSYFKTTDEEDMYISLTDTNIPIETIVQALLPEGEKMYDNLILYGKYSKDGQDHEIHSMAEFLEWYQEIN